MSYLLIRGDARRISLADRSVSCVVTSPPYWGLRDYGVAGQIGLEPSPDAYVREIVQVFREVRRVLADDGTLWLNLGDSYATQSPIRVRNRIGYESRPKDHLLTSRPSEIGLKHKDLIGIPWRVAFALQADGWYLRSDVIWEKRNPMPESVEDRPTKAHEYVFLLAKRDRYFYDADAVREPDKGKPAGNVDGFKNCQGAAAFHARSGGVGSDGWRVGTGRNLRSVWTITPQPFRGSHFAVMPTELASRCIKAGSPPGSIVFDPFSGVGSTCVAALALGRRFVGTELNPKYLRLARRRIERPHAPPPREGKAESLPLFGLDAEAG